MRTPLPRIHAVTDERIARQATLGVLAAALTRGAGSDLALHARGHALAGREHYALACTLGACAPALLFVSDRLDVALVCHATGVQLAWTRWAPAEARRLERAWWIGCSVHRLDEAEAARSGGADYLLLGPMFPTRTHPEHRPLESSTVRQVVALGLPVIAIGGVEHTHVGELVAAGFYGVAAIRSLWDAPDPEDAARSFQAAWAHA